MRVAIIGAGGAGLCAGRHCLTEDFRFDIFEQTGNVGGTWNYTERVGVDENGLEVHSSMYKGLRTNLPKELMQYEDFPYPPQEKSYVYQEDVVEYLNSYTRNFQLTPHIRFFTQVLNVEPDGTTWMVEVEDVKTKLREQLEYDAVIVCNGHYKQAFVPEINGLDTFSGHYMHSHDFRTPDSYKNKRVLVLGAGPSGLDISHLIETVANEVFISFKPSEDVTPVSPGVISKPLLQELTGNEATFEDGTREDIDEILFCTGYRYSFPFLSQKCKVKTIEKYVHPLYKHIISIENPTLGFIGLPVSICPFPEFDIQVRFFLSTLSGHFTLPPKQELLADLQRDLEGKTDVPQRYYHKIGEKQGEYFNDLADTAKIKTVAPVITKLFIRVRMNKNLEDCFRIIDDDNFVQIS